MSDDARQRTATLLAGLRAGMTANEAGVPDDGNLQEFGSWRDGVAVLIAAAPRGTAAIEQAYRMLCSDGAWLGLSFRAGLPYGLGGGAGAPPPPPLLGCRGM